ncbi:hypothetical protein AUK22_01460 [bacterium CG2_30_54_10]|nr:MAG: hypothetical protein AUK22_01460 [bacterium CG2_30_54_10]
MPLLVAGIPVTPETFAPYVMHKALSKSQLVSSGIIDKSPVFDKLISGGGLLVDMPFWMEPNDDSEIQSDTVDATVNSITGGNDKARVHFRRSAWGASDLAGQIAGSDPLENLANMLAGYWARQDQKLLINSLTGLFADNLANDAGDLILDISIADGAAVTASNKIIGSSIIDAKSKLGDNHDLLTAIVMHSVPFHQLEKNSLIEYVRVVNAAGVTQSVSEGSPNGAQGVPTIFGRRVIVDDSCPAVATGLGGGVRYSSYLFGSGAVAMGEVPSKTPFEVARNAKRGIDELYVNRQFILHPRGIAWTNATCAGSSPTFAEVALAANWNRVWNQKGDVRIVKLVTNG